MNDKYIDIGTIVVYCLAVMGVGFWVGRRGKATSNDYFLAGRRLPWFAITASFVASGMSSEQMVGMVGQAYQHGLVLANWCWLFFPIYTLLIWVFLPLYLRNKISTMPEYLEKRYGATCRDVYALITVAVYVFVSLSTVMFAGGFVMQDMLGLPLRWGIICLALVGGLYTIYGGLASVVWTDVIQFLVLFGGSIVLFILGLQAVDGGWSTMINAAPPSRAHLVQPLDHPLIPWPALLIVPLTSGLWYSCTNQSLIQRCLAARSEWDTRMAIIAAGAVALIRPIVEVFPGMLAYNLYKLEKPDLALTTMIKNLVPVGARGLILAAFLAAVISTINALINSTTTIITLDLYRKHVNRSAGEARLVSIGKRIGIVVLIVAMFWAPQVGRFPSIFEYFQKFIIYLATPVAVVFLTGVLWKRATRQAALVVMVCGIPMSFLLEQILPTVWPALASNGGVSFFYLGAVTWLVCVPLMIAISLFTPAPRAGEVESLVWNRATAQLPAAERIGLPLYKRPWPWWLLVGVLCAGLYIVYW